ncbi:UNVERIFIED_ORG: DNA mismatch repair protein MutS [Anaplasma ovis]
MLGVLAEGLVPVMDKYKSDDSGPGDDLWWRSVAKLAHPIAEGKKKVTAGRKLADISRPVGCAGGRGRQALTQATESPALTQDGGVCAIGAHVQKRQSSPGLYACTEEYGLFSSIDAGTKARVDKGKYPIDKVIDLHGHSEASARDSLVEFVKSSFQSGHRCIRVITGWGSKNSGNNSIKSNLHRWLQLDSIVDMVLYYRQAIPAHGGKGAFYILLRTNKKA